LRARRFLRPKPPSDIAIIDSTPASSDAVRSPEPPLDGPSPVAGITMISGAGRGVTTMGATVLTGAEVGG